MLVSKHSYSDRTLFLYISRAYADTREQRKSGNRENGVMIKDKSRKRDRNTEKRKTTIESESKVVERMFHGK